MLHPVVIMVGMDMLLIVVLVAVVGVAAALVAVEVTGVGTTRPPPYPPVRRCRSTRSCTRRWPRASAEMRIQTAGERDAAVMAALQQSAVMQREQLGYRRTAGSQRIRG